MPRYAYLLLALLAATPAIAAPVLKALAKTEDERLWHQLGEWGLPQIIEAVGRLSAEPERARKLFEAKLRPLKLDETRAKQLIEQLSAEKENDWKAAQDELMTLDPRLVMTVPEAWELTKTDDQRGRLARVLTDQDISDVPVNLVRFALNPPQGFIKEWTIQFERRPGIPQTAFDKNTPSGGSLHLPLTTADVAKTNRWQRQVFAIRLLDRISTESALKLVAAMAEGHKDAGPTVAAKAVLERRKNPPAVVPLPKGIAAALDTRKQFDALFERWGAEFQIDALFKLLDRPAETNRLLRTTLRPVKLDKKRADELLDRLFSNNVDVWRPALQELMYHDLRLVYEVPVVWERAKTDDQRAKLGMALVSWGRYADFSYYLLCTVHLEPPNPNYGYWHLNVVGKPEVPAEKFPGGRRPDETAPARQVLTEVAWERWFREESAIYILDAIGTDDALAIIKDMATGHPDAGPTKAAKAVLKRRGK